MKKRLVITRADERVKETTDLTHPIMKKYIKKCNADFKILTGNEKPPMNHYRVFKFYDLFDEYERIMHLDSDIIIKNDCPDLFDYVPEDSIGIIYEDKGSRLKHRRSLIQAIQEKRENIGWTTGYINGGISVFSRIHKEIFNPNMYEDLWMDFGQADVELGFRIKKLNLSVFELDYTFNHMSMFSEQWNNFKSRFDSYIIHYAGNGFFPGMPRHKQIKEDIALLRRYGEV